MRGFGNAHSVDPRLQSKEALHLVTYGSGPAENERRNPISFKLISTLEDGSALVSNKDVSHSDI